MKIDALKEKKRQHEEILKTELHQLDEEFIILGYLSSDLLSNKQFTEMMQGWWLDPKKDLNQIHSIGYRGHIQKKDSKLLHETMDRHEAEIKTSIVEDKTEKSFIHQMFLEEMKTHEYGYTGVAGDTLNALGYTREQVTADKRLLHGFLKAQKQIMKE